MECMIAVLKINCNPFQDWKCLVGNIGDGSFIRAKFKSELLGEPETHHDDSVQESLLRGRLSIGSIKPDLNQPRG